MKVTNSTIHNGIRTPKDPVREKRSATDGSQETQTARGADRVALSGVQEKVERLTNAVATLENTNVDKIESLKSRIADGTYQVSGYDVAEKMLRSLGIRVPDGDRQ